MSRRFIGVAMIVALVVFGGWYVLAARSAPAETVELDLSAQGSYLYVDRSGKVAQSTAGVHSGRSCLRVYTAGGTTVCLRSVAAPPSFEAVVLGPDLALVRTVKLDGTPSRARVSPSGRLVAWTVFRNGDSYLPTGHFSTTAGIYDNTSGTLYGSLEDFTSVVDGVEHHASDRNFWGVTFASDDKTFYATLSSGGRTWLMRGDLATRRMTSVRENAECPSLSPDGGRVAYKKRTGDRWRLHVLDLATGVEVPLAEEGHVDDQATWLDTNRIAYAKAPGKDEPPALFTVPANGSGTPTLLRKEATSPSPVQNHQST